MRKVEKTIANFQLPKSLKKRAESRARKEGISFAAWNRRLIIDALSNGDPSSK